LENFGGFLSEGMCVILGLSQIDVFNFGTLDVVLFVHNFQSYGFS
jgi:hypothetical protein